MNYIQQLYVLLCYIYRSNCFHLRWKHPSYPLGLFPLGLFPLELFQVIFLLLKSFFEVLPTFSLLL